MGWNDFSTERKGASEEARRREIFDWIEKDLDNNEPNEVEMRWLCAKSIIHTLNEHIEDYVKEQEQTE